MPFCSKRLPSSHTPATTPSAIIKPYAWIFSGPMLSVPLDGLGMLATTPANPGNEITS